MQKKAKNRVVIDTNLWISYLLSGRQMGLNFVLRDKSIAILFCEQLWEELIDVIRRPKFRHVFTDDIIAFLHRLLNRIYMVQIDEYIVGCRDENDNFILSLAHCGKADFLITGDKDLLDLKHVGNTEIMTLRNFTAREVKRHSIERLK